MGRPKGPECERSYPNNYEIPPLAALRSSSRIMKYFLSLEPPSEVHEGFPEPFRFWSNSLRSFRSCSVGMTRWGELVRDDSVRRSG